MKRKRRSLNQIKEDISCQILREKIPESWVIHEYGPDYGIDLAIELFDFIDDDRTMAETLGEHLFVQLKASSSVEYGTRRVYSRMNVEKEKLNEDKSEYLDIDVAKFKLEMSEILTVQSMGTAIPVLLILIDTNTKRAFFICLNDYIDKVLIPEDPNYLKKESKTLYIPLRNEILNCQQNLVALRAYGKRSKMQGAFSKFFYQKNEIEHAVCHLRCTDFADPESIHLTLEMINIFTEASIRQDIWKSHEFWRPIQWSYNELTGVKYRLEQGIEFSEYPDFFNQCVSIVWPRLANLGNMYEELVREWYLPTYMAQFLSYAQIPDSLIETEDFI